MVRGGTTPAVLLRGRPEKAIAAPIVTNANTSAPIILSDLAIFNPLYKLVRCECHQMCRREANRIPRSFQPLEAQALYREVRQVTD